MISGSISTSRLTRDSRSLRERAVLAPRLESRKHRAQRWCVFTAPFDLCLVGGGTSGPLFSFLPAFLLQVSSPPPLCSHFIYFSTYWYSSLRSGFPPFPSLAFFYFLSGPLFSTPKASRGLKMLLTLVRHLGPSGDCEKGCETETAAPHSTAAFPSATAPRSEVIGLLFLSLLLLLSDRSILIASSHCGLLE